MSQQEVHEIQVSLEEVKEQIELGDLLETLEKHPAFQKLVLKGYFEKEAIHLVGMFSHPMPEMQKEVISNKMIGIGAFQAYLNTIYRKAETAKASLEDYELTLQEAAEELENSMSDVNVMEMSDEDFMNAPSEDLKRVTPSDEPEDDSDESEEELEQTVDDDVNSDDTDEEGSSEDADDTDDSEDDEEDTEEGESTEEVDKTPDEEAEPSDDDAEDKLNYQAEYEELLKPFKAHGRDFSVKDTKEIKRLMEMGVDYSEKMRAFKPHRKIHKMLENHGLLDESKLSYLIDLDKKDPAAISKLIKDSGVNLLDLDNEDNTKYTPSDHSVGDSAVKLDEVIERIQSTATFTDTMDLVNDKWDDTSKRTLVGKPELIEVINTHMSNGTYKAVMTEVDRARTFGGLSGLSDLEAYQQTGMAMQKAGKFDAKPATVVETKPTVETSNRKDKKRKASPTKKSPSSSAKKELSPLAMSDEDFIKKFG